MADELDFTINANMHSAFKREVRRLHVGLKSANLSDPPAVAGLQRRYQFFSDTQFEAYRRLGEQTVQRLLAQPTPGAPTIDDLFIGAERHLEPRAWGGDSP